MEITRKDLVKLNTVYWYYEGLGEDYSLTTNSLRDIYFFCEGKLNEAEGEMESAEPILLEDSAKHRPKVRHRDKVHSSKEAAGD